MNDVDEDEAYVSGASGQSPSQRAVHVATRKPGKRRTAASDVDDSGTNEELQRRLVDKDHSVITDDDYD